MITERPPRWGACAGWARLPRPTPLHNAWSPWCAGPGRSQEKERCQPRVFGGRSSAKNQMTLGDQLGQCRRAWNRRSVRRSPGSGEGVGRPDRDVLRGRHGL